MHRIPFLRLVLPFAVAIVVYEYCNVDVWAITLIAVIFLALFAVSWLPIAKDIAIRYNRWIGIVIMTGCFSLAYLYVYHSSPSKPIWPTGNEMVMRVKLLEAPQHREKSYRAEAEMLSYMQDGLYKASSGKILLYFSKEIGCDTWQPDDEIILSAKLNAIDGPKNPGEFDLHSYNKRKGIYFRGFVQPGQLLSYKASVGWSLKKWMHQARTYLLDLSAKHFNSPSEKALSDALVLGYQDDLDEETVSRFAKSGTSHVLAVSGLHIGVLWLVLDKVLLFFLNRYMWSRWLKLFLALGILWAYALLTGLSPSVMRSAVMFSCFSVGGIMKQKHISLNILFVSAFIQMLIEPMVLFNIGFQLSYSAVGSILIFYQPIRNAVYFNDKWGKMLWETVALTLSAQIITTPISLYWFGQFPVWFIFSNLILVPISSVALMVGLAAFAMGWIPHLGNLLFHLFMLSIKTMDSLAAFFANLPYALLHVKLNMWEVVLLYILTILIALFLIKKKAVWFKLIGLCICCFLAMGIVKEYTLDKHEKWIFYSLKSGMVIRRIKGHEVWEYRSELADRKNYSYSVKPSDKIFDITQHRKVYDKNGFVQLGSKRIVILNKEHITAKLAQPVICDWIILEAFKFVDFDRLQHNFRFDKLIMGGGNSRKSKMFWRKECLKRNIAFHDAAESGALIEIEER